MNKFKQFKTSVSNLIKFSSGTPAESAPLDVHCKKVTITFGDPEKKEEHLMCLLAWCGFHGRLEFAHHLIHKGASMLIVDLHTVYIYCSDRYHDGVECDLTQCIFIYCSA